MDYNIGRLVKPLTYLILIVLFLFLVQGPSVAQDTGSSKIIFIVK
jgi:hypothetical protein